MANTTNRSYPLPVDTKTVRQEIENLQQNVLPMIDTDVQDLFDQVADLAPIDHTHTIGEITDLTTTLAGKMPAGTTFALSDLTDVVGSAEAPDGYILAKVGEEYVAQAALAALGPHGHTIAEVSGLGDALNAKMATSALPAQLASVTHAAAAKAIPIDADEFGFWDSVTGELRRLTWSNQKAAFLAYFVTKFARVDADQAFSAAEQAQIRKNLGIKFGYPLLNVQDRKAQGVSGGSSVPYSGINTRVLNTVIVNEIAGASLSSNQITLPAGTYYAEISAPAYTAARHKVYLVNSTAGVDLIYSPNEYANNSAGVQSTARASGRFVLSVTSVVDMRHVIQTETTTDGLGVAINLPGYPEIYADAKIWKLK